MSVKIVRKLKLLKLIEESKDEFKAEVKKTVPPEIIKTILGGNSPIKGGKQPKYSESYLAQITGKRKDKDGKPVGINSRSTSKGANSALKYGKNGNSRKTNKVTTSLQSRFGKLKSPVNLKLTGEMLASMETTETKNGQLVTFTDEKAEWHNEGVPENNLPPRRLLPNKDGEEFNANIFKRIMKALQDAVKKSL